VTKQGLPVPSLPDFTDFILYCFLGCFLEHSCHTELAEYCQPCALDISVSSLIWHFKITLTITRFEIKIRGRAERKTQNEWSFYRFFYCM
jgi:hypothetical protein